MRHHHGWISLPGLFSCQGGAAAQVIKAIKHPTKRSTYNGVLLSLKKNTLLTRYREAGKKTQLAPRSPPWCLKVCIHLSSSTSFSFQIISCLIRLHLRAMVSISHPLIERERHRGVWRRSLKPTCAASSRSQRVGPANGLRAVPSPPSSLSK